MAMALYKFEGKKPIIGKSQTVLVSKDTTPKVTPSDMAPVSPIKKRAGLILNHKKASNAPAMTPQKAAKSTLPCKKAMAPKEAKAANKVPPAKPSRPSISLTEKEVATIIKINIGMYHKPISTVPIKGKYKTVQDNL